MDKLNIEDIEVLNEGQQVKKLIEAKYGTLKNFYQQENPPIALKTIMNYCCSNRIYSGVFKCFIVTKFDKSWEEIIIPKSEQIRKYVYEIYNNIVLYIERADIESFNKLLDLCTKNRLVNESALMLRNIAINYYYRNDKEKTIEYFNKAIDLIRNKDIDILVSLTVELADYYFQENDIDEYETLYNKAQSYIKNNKLSNQTLYKYCYRIGVIYNTQGKYTDAKKYLEEAIQYAEIQTEAMSEKGACFLSLGSTHKRLRDYEKAKQYYCYSLEYFHDKDVYGRITALNNLADIYCILHDYDNAIKYIEKAKSLLSEDSLISKFLLVSQTYAEIKLMIGDTSGCYEYFNFLKKTTKSSVSKKDIKRYIIILINYLEAVDLLEELYNAICYMIDNTDNYVYKDELYSCIGRIIIKIRKKEVYNE